MTSSIVTRDVRFRAEAEETATALFNLAKEYLEQLKARPST
ncbi:hypothetical protein [Mesorhizobium sp. M0408]